MGRTPLCRSCAGNRRHTAGWNGTRRTEGTGPAGAVPWGNTLLAFGFRLAVAHGNRIREWLNRLTGRRRTRNRHLSNRLSRFRDSSIPSRSRPNPRDPAQTLETGWRRCAVVPGLPSVTRTAGLRGQHRTFGPQDLPFATRSRSDRHRPTSFGPLRPSRFAVVIATRWRSCGAW